MSIKEIKSGTLYKEYALEIPYDEINKIIDSKINELLPTVSLPGFRKGKAPINIVRKKYENNVLSESLNKLVQDKMKELLDEKKLKPFTQPKIDLKKYEKNEPIEVEIKIDLEPEIKLTDFKNKDKIAASKEFEKDLAAEADLTKGQIKKVHKMADELPKKDFKDRYGKEKGDSVRYATATNIVKKKEGIKEMQQIDEKIKGIENNSEKSGIPYGILKQVYNRGMAAWKGGHRPGTTPQQWAMARVNAFITKGKAYYTADADLAKKARAAKKGK